MGVSSVAELSPGVGSGPFDPSSVIETLFNSASRPAINVLSTVTANVTLRTSFTARLPALNSKMPLPGDVSNPAR